jgi:hypothetical protein
MAESVNMQVSPHTFVIGRANIAAMLDAKQRRRLPPTMATVVDIGEYTVDRVGGGNDSYWTLVIEKKLIGQLILN